MSDRVAVVTLQVAILLLPPVIALGGMPGGLAAAALVLGLLLATMRARGAGGGPAVPGLLLLAVFVGLGLATTIPLPPAVLARIAPTTAAWYSAALPGWPDAGPWSHWRPLAIDPTAVCIALAQLGAAAGLFAIVAARPWRRAEERAHALGRLTLTLVGAGAVLAVAALTLTAAGYVDLLPRDPVAAWLGLTIPIALALLFLRGAPLTGRMRAAAPARLGVGARARAWAATLTANQHQLWPVSLLALVVLLLLLAAVRSGSYAGLVAVCAALAVTGAGLVSDGGRRRRAAAALAGACALAAVGILALWALHDSNMPLLGSGGESGLVARLAHAAGTARVVREQPLVGVGLGGLAQALPFTAARGAAPGSNDIVELAGETGLLGLGLLIAFVVAVVRASRRPVSREAGVLRWGLLGALVALLVQGLLAPGFRPPMNFLGALLLLGLLLLAAPPAAARRSPSLALLVLLLGATLVSLLADVTRGLGGSTPQALATRAVDRAPLDRSVRVALIDALGPGPAGDGALRNAVRLWPDAVRLHDALALRLWEQRKHEEGAAELEESVFRTPTLALHPALSEGFTSGTPGPLDPGAGITPRLRALDDGAAAAVDRGLGRALDAADDPAARLGIVGDLATLREARARYADAATALEGEASRGVASGALLARAARDQLRAGDAAAAERALRAALRDAPAEGELYRRLAIEVYASRGDLTSAQEVLHAGEQRALNRLPVYRGVTELLARLQAQGAPTEATP